jgi:hypothetical protein
MGWTEKSSQLEDEKEGTKKLKHVILAEFICNGPVTSAKY